MRKLSELSKTLSEGMKDAVAQEKAKILNALWERDKVLSSVTHHPAFHPEFYRDEDGNKALARIFEDTALFMDDSEGNTLKRIHRLKVSDPLMRTSKEDTYKSLV